MAQCPDNASVQAQGRRIHQMHLEQKALQAEVKHLHKNHYSLSLGSSKKTRMLESLQVDGKDAALRAAAEQNGELTSQLADRLQELQNNEGMINWKSLACGCVAARGE